MKVPAFKESKGVSTENPLALPIKNRFYVRKLKFLRIAFAPEISAVELPLFRGAVIAAVDRSNVLFHNHREEGFRYAYPLIQYKRQHHKPVLICLDEGADAIHTLFQQRVHQLRLGQRHIALDIEAINLREITLQVWDRAFRYRIHHWLALHGPVYLDYRNKATDAERLQLLESILRGNILSMAKGLGWFIERRVEVRIHRVLGTRVVDFKDTQMSAFDVEFDCNVLLPGGIGLGKGAALGHGILSTLKTNTLDNDDSRNDLPGRLGA